MSAQDVRRGLEEATGEVLDTDEKQIDAIMRITGMGRAEATDELRIARGEFPEDAVEMACH